jgi:hypothetical protein
MLSSVTHDSYDDLWDTVTQYFATIAIDLNVKSCRIHSVFKFIGSESEPPMIAKPPGQSDSAVQCTGLPIDGCAVRLCSLVCSYLMPMHALQ